MSRYFFSTFHVTFIAWAPTFFKLFFIMFEFIYLFVIIQKEQCRLIPSYNGLLHKPVFTKVFQLNLQKSPWGWRRE